MAHQRALDRFNLKAAHKALDLTMDDDMTITQNGVTGKVVLGVIALLVSGVLGWKALTPGVPAPPAVAPQEYEVEFWLEGEAEVPLPVKV